MSVKIGALWKHKYKEKDGSEKSFYSGDLVWPGVQGRVKITLNDKKGNDKAPDLTMWYDPMDANQKKGQAQGLITATPRKTGTYHSKGGRI